MTDIELQLNAWDKNSGKDVFCVQGEQNTRVLRVTLIDRTGENDPLSSAEKEPRYLDLTGYTARMFAEKGDGRDTSHKEVSLVAFISICSDGWI